MKILGIESTCDETGAAVVENGRKVLSNILASSANLQDKYGGIVPEIAAREQIKDIIPVVKKALTNIDISEIEAIAISFGPGLLGSLLIGVETAKALAVAWNKPIIPVNHLVAHLYANWISLHKLPEFPLLGLVVSGGHTDLVYMSNHGKFRLIGSTLDDSAGEAFDKVARLLNLKYPGGPEIEDAAKKYSNNKRKSIIFPRPMIRSNNFDFSFSGLKTAVVNTVQNSKFKIEDVNEIAYEFQNAVTDVLIRKTIAAAEKFECKTIVVGGGVSANEQLRAALTDKSVRHGIKIYFPSKLLSVDNGAMIASAAFFENNQIDPINLQADSSLHF